MREASPTTAPSDSLLHLPERVSRGGCAVMMMADSPMDLEELLLSTLDAVSRFRVGQREAVWRCPGRWRSVDHG